MSRFTLRTAISLALLAVLLTSCTLIDDLVQQSIPEPQEPSAPVETAPEEPGSASPMPEDTAPAAHGETAETPTAEDQGSSAEPQIIGPENAAMLQEAARVAIENPYRLVWSTDGEKLGMLAQGGLSVLDGKTLETLSTVVVEEPITVLDFSPTTSLMATTSDQINLDLREITSGQIVRTISPENGFSNAVFSTDGRLVALTAWDEIAVTLWDAETGQQTKKLTGFETAAPVYGVTFSKDDRYLIWVARGSAQVMEIASGAMGAFLGHEDFIGDAKLAPNGYLLAVTTAGTIDGEYMPIIQIWDQLSGQSLGTLVEGTSVSQSLAFSPDGRLLVATIFNELAIWDVNSKEKLISVPGHTDIVTSATFSPDGRTLASASADGTVRLWQVK